MHYAGSVHAALAKDTEKACALLTEHYEATTGTVLKHTLLGGNQQDADHA